MSTRGNTVSAGLQLWSGPSIRQRRPTNRLLKMSRPRVAGLSNAGRFGLGSLLRKYDADDDERSYLLVGLTERYIGLDISLPMGKSKRNSVEALSLPQTSLHSTVRATVDYWGGEWMP